MSPTFKHRRGHKIHYVEEGKGVPVVFAHGFVMDHTMFAAQFEDLPDTYRCIAWDMRGHGHSECPSGPWSIADIVGDLAEFIEAMGPPCHLVGMSLGGMAAVRVALDHASSVRSLVMIDSSADGLDPALIDAYRGFQSTVERDGITEELVRETVPLFYGATYIDAHPDAIAYHVQRVKDMKPEAVIEGLRVVIERGSVVDRLGEIKVPTLVIHGEHDAAIPISAGEQTAAGISGAKLVRVPVAGHTTPIETPDAVNEALTGFFRG